MKTVAILGTFDTKGEELSFVAEQVISHDCRPLLIDVSTGESHDVRVDITPKELCNICRSIGFQPVSEDLAHRLEAYATGGATTDRGEAVSMMTRVAEVVVRSLYDDGRFDAIFSLGGGGGTSIATAAMRALPIGVPKLMVSTLAGGDVSAYVGTKDIVMMPSIVDVSGINRVSRGVFTQAAAAICAMTTALASTTLASTTTQDRPVIVASMFGNTTQCVQAAKVLLEDAGYEVLVFHATGAGGRAMEDLIASGMVSGVLDLTTTELADELLGGIMSAGADRLTAAANAGIPAVVAPGCLDMANFGPPSTIPEKYRDRKLYRHNADNTLVRTNESECRELGQRLSEKVNSYSAPAMVLIPAKGVSVISTAEGPFTDAKADRALFDAIKSNCEKTIIELDCAINDAQFAQAAAEKLLLMMPTQP